MPFNDSELPRMLKEGFHFSCQFCGRCCTGFDEGDVYLYRDDILRLVSHLNGGKCNDRVLKEFARQYLKITHQTFYWKDDDAKRGKNYRIEVLGFKFTGTDQHCEFMGKDNKCSVYKAAPFQCISYPWWQMHLDKPRKLKEYSKKCPALDNGFKNEGEYIAPKKILELVEEEKRLEEAHFLEMQENNFDIFEVFKFLPSDMEYED